METKIKNESMNNRITTIVNDMIGLIGLSGFFGGVWKIMQANLGYGIQLVSLFFFMVINHRKITTGFIEIVFGIKDFFQKLFNCKKN